jgi:hypothetical protein
VATESNTNGLCPPSLTLFPGCSHQNTQLLHERQSSSPPKQNCHILKLILPSNHFSHRLFTFAVDLKPKNLFTRCVAFFFFFFFLLARSYPGRRVLKEKKKVWNTSVAVYSATVVQRPIRSVPLHVKSLSWAVGTVGTVGTDALRNKWKSNAASATGKLNPNWFS